MISDVELISEFIKSKATLSRSTLTHYKSALNKFRQEIDVPMMEVEEKHVANYISQYGYLKTKKTYLGHLRVFYKWCAKRGFIASNPAEDVKVKNGEKKRFNHMSSDEFRTILDKCNGIRDSTIVAFMYYTGVRALELQHLKDSDIDLVSEVVHVRVSKTSNGQRILPIHPNLKIILVDYMEKIRQIKMDTNNDCEYLFMSKYGTQLKPRTLQYLIKEIQEGTGLVYGCHDFRRAFVTNVYFATKDIVMAQDLAGHASINTTRTYILKDPRSKQTKFSQFRNINFN